MIDNFSVQRWLADGGFYAAKIDGIVGFKTNAAFRTALVAASVDLRGNDWPDSRCRIAVEQLMLRDAGLPVGPIDGRDGPQTHYALERWQDAQRDKVVSPAEAEARAAAAPVQSPWPRQPDVPAVFGKAGSRLVKMLFPYPMRLAWDPKTVVASTMVHELVHDSARRCFAAALDHYGLAQLQVLGLDLFGGCYQDRAMRGGTAKSMHAWGIAFDINPSANPLRADHRTAKMDDPPCVPFLDIWQAEGWVSLGRARDYDWMHVQAARL